MLDFSGIGQRTLSGLIRGDFAAGAGRWIGHDIPYAYLELISDGLNRLGDSDAALICDS
jgi:hypothetical protein